jgi:multisubunit Na+/H+ antiporter MnhB subunit
MARRAYVPVMKINYLILGLITLSVVLSLYMMGNPEHAEKLSQMSREMGLKGEAREMALTALAFGLGVFIVYLAITRR